MFDMINYDDEMICFPTGNLGYDFKDGLPKEFPEVVEYFLEKDVFEEIKR